MFKLDLSDFSTVKDDSPLYRHLNSPEKKDAWENSGIEQWWGEEQDQILLDRIQRQQWYFHFDVFEEVIPQSESFDKWLRTKQVRALCDKGEIAYHVQQMIQYYSLARAEHLGWIDQYIRDPETKTCPACGEKFKEDEFSLKQFRQLGSDVRRLVICPCIFGPKYMWYDKTKTTKEEICLFLRDLTNALQRIPSQSFGEGANDFINLTDEERIEIAKVMQRKPHLKRVKELFGSWLEALKESGVLDSDAKQTSRGIRCIANDGHVCLSLGEKTIDDTLYALGIPHEKETYYPGTNFRTDFEVNGIFIEYFGLTGNEAYDEKIELKKKLCKKHGIKLVAIYPEDLANIQTLEKKLLEHLK